MKTNIKKLIAVVSATAILVFCLTACSSTKAIESKDKVTFSISCKVLLEESNKEKLPEEKRNLVPEDGLILKPIEVAITDGESVFDVLLRTCKEQKVHMEYMDTPLYDSAYIEGIGNLYEFDAGNLSGWMFSVNGEYPNYGCSKIYVHDGDTIEWNFTCSLGKDLGHDFKNNEK